MDFSLLISSPVFRGLNADEIKNAMGTIFYQTKKYNPGSLIAQSGDVLSALYIIVSGSTRGEMIDYNARVIKIEDIHAPGTLAPAFLFGEKNMFPVNVIASTNTELLMIPKADFLKLLRNNDIILNNFLGMISSRSQFLSEKIKFLSFKTIKSKLAHYILQKAGKTKSSIVFDITQNELASFFGVARPSVARALGELEEAGYIEARGKNIKILDKDKLSIVTSD